MKMPAFTALVLLAFSWASAADSPMTVRARTVDHANGTHTESIQNPDLHEQREYTYDQRNVLISKKVYLLNEKGQTIQGNIYDGRDVLKARASFLFDDFGRMIEQRMTNLQGEVYQTIVFPYDARGLPLTPKSRTYNVQSPDMKPAMIDFTNTGNAPRPMDRKADATQNLGNVPRLPEAGTGQQPAPTNNGGPAATSGTDDPSKKRSIWQRMFTKDKKEEKK